MRAVDQRSQAQSIFTLFIYFAFAFDSPALLTNVHSTSFPNTIINSSMLTHLVVGNWKKRKKESNTLIIPAYPTHGAEYSNRKRENGKPPKIAD